MLDRIQGLYADYAAEFQRLEQNRRMGAGMFGLGGGPKDDPCHERFAKDLERLLREGADECPEQAESVLEFIWFASPARPEGWDAVSWMWLAVHSMTVELVGHISPEAAGRLRERYENAYPRRERLPAQKKVISALKKRERQNA